MKLKHFFYSLMLLCITASCYNPDDGEFTQPITLYESIAGRWSLTGLTMTDELAVATNISPSKQNIGGYFNYADFVLDLNADSGFNPTNYKVNGDVPPLFPATGYWKLSNDFQQTNSMGTSIFLYQDAQKTVKTGELKVVSVPGSSNEMELQLVRVSGGAPIISYNFKLKAID